jgi:hypothetical protein
MNEDTLKGLAAHLSSSTSQHPT